MPTSSEGKNRWRVLGVHLALVALPLALYLAQSLTLRGWLMDDAGISFVYARNLAAGHGLVSQPGMPPVEGYSNPLWVLIMVPFFWAGLFEPFLTSKLVSVCLVAATFYLMGRIARMVLGGRRWPGLVATCLLATNASYVIWTSSGLENPLWACLTVLLAYRLLTAVERSAWTGRDAIACAVISAALALTRPEGILFAAAFPAVAVISSPLSRRTVRKSLSVLAPYAALLAVIMGAFLLFRLLYFGDLYPNTYYVKGGPDWASLQKLVTMQESYVSKLRELSSGLLGRQFWSLLPIGFIAWVTALCFRWGRRQRDVALLTMTLIAWFAYMLLPTDWMGEFRFATAFFPLAYLSAAVLLTRAILAAPKHRLRKCTVTAVMLAAMVGSAALHYPRLAVWARRPIVSFAGIADRFGHQFNRWADHLGLTNASFLVPDIGGTLYYSNLRIYDLAGLTDRVIARTRPNNEMFEWDIEAFYDYVFDSLKPTFIHTHGSFTMRSQFDQDERFARDYLPISEYADEYASTRLKRRIMSGDYIRRDVAADRMELLEQIVEGEIR